MRILLRLGGLSLLALYLTSCATDSANNEEPPSAGAQEIQAFGEKDLSTDNSKSADQAAESKESTNLAQDTAKVEDELKLDEDKEQPVPEDLQTFEDAPAEKTEPPAQVAEQPPPPEVQEAPAPPTGSPVRIMDLQFLSAQKGGTVLIKTSGPAQYQTRRNESENQFIVEIENATLPSRLKRPYITKEFNSPVASINAYQSKGSTTARIVVQLRDATEMGVEQQGNSLSIAATGAAAAEQPVATAEAAEAPTGGDDLGETQASTFDEFVTGNTKFYGRKINIEVTDEDVRNVFKLIAEESGANIVLDDKVSGNITVKLREIPWDQALVVVLKTKGLGYVRQGNVLRIAQLETLKKESDTARDLLSARVQLDPLNVKVIPVNYANVDDLVKQLEKFKTARGQVASDSRTSSIVITDTVETIERITKLIKTLDVEPDQVLIEGKIVEATDQFTRNLGVNWKSSGQPISMGTSGKGLPVNLTPSAQFGQGVPQSASGLLFNMNVGTLDVLGNLTASLALFESESIVKVVSSPRVVAINREKAFITQSDQRPVSQLTAGTPPTATTTYVTAELRLEVVPQITPEGGVILDMNVKREGFGTSADPTAAPPKFGREAKTRVLVHSGQTAVIGGIYNNSQTEGESGVPGLRKIPVLGWLFKNRTRDLEKNELVIFLTPRILAKTSLAKGANE